MQILTAALVLACGASPVPLPVPGDDTALQLRSLAVEHWQDATDQGAVAGAGSAGQPANWEAVPGFWTTIGDTTVKYHAWGDGYEGSRLLDRDGGFTVWYERDGAVVGVLTCNADDDYDLGETLIAAGRPAPVPLD